MLLNFLRRLSILLLQTSKTDNHALNIELFITSNLEKINLIQQTALLPNYMQNFHGLPLWQNNVNRECILHYLLHTSV
jgi:hypothetical protein